MRNIKSFLIISILTISTFSFVKAQEILNISDNKLIEEYKAFIKEKMQANHLVGVGAALILGDSVVWKQGFGYADKENKIPFTTQTVWRIGSITKPFTAMGIMQLHEKKLLDINKPLVDYLPEFRIKTRKTSIKEITVKSVIQHTSGIPNEIFQDSRDDKENYTKVVDYLKNEYLGYPVNLVFHYSNVGYCLLGHTILKVSQQGYPEYIQDNILKPIGMNNSGFMDHSTLKNVSKTYDSTGTYQPQKYNSNIPAGCLFSTIDDMAIFAKEMIAIYNGKRNGFLKPETLKIFDEITNDNLQNYNSCFAWAVYKNDSSLVLVAYGSNHLSNAGILIDLKKKMAAIFFVNTVGGMNLVGDAIGNIMKQVGITQADYGHSYPYKNQTAIDVSVDSLKAHTGVYVTTTESNVVRFENDKLILNSVYGNFELKPQTNSEFIPGRIYKPDSVKWYSAPRFIFNEVMGYKMLFWQDANYKRQPLGHLVVPKEITEIWKSRLGKYKHMVENIIDGWDKFTEAELSISDNNLLQLKLFYTSGEYLYYLTIENDNELIFCGFDTHGGETIRFSKEGQNDIMKLYGLSMKKIN